MDEEDLAELRDSQTLVLQNEEVDIAGRYAGDLSSKSPDVENDQECAICPQSFSVSYLPQLDVSSIGKSPPSNTKRLSCC